MGANETVDQQVTFLSIKTQPAGLASPYFRFFT